MKVKAVDVIGNYDEIIENTKKTINEGMFSGKMVIYSNTIARQASKFTLEEEKILHMIFSQINPHSKNNTQIILNKAELIKKLNIKSGSNYTALHDRMAGMIKKSLVKIKADRTNMVGVVISGVSWQDYMPDLVVELNPMFMPYIEELANFYTKLELDAIIQFKSKYTLNLYKYLSSWRGEHFNRMIGLETDKLKEILGIGETDYINKLGAFDRYNFEKYTIKTAVNEINEKVPGWRMEWRKVKNGKYVSGYLFEWVIMENINL